jgi:(p)ppGpp synthase/HD superfamily hydrolase
MPILSLAGGIVFKGGYMNLDFEISLLASAYRFAAEAHLGQYRKYAKMVPRLNGKVPEPYVHHPIEVAELVASVPSTKAMVAAAVLHDVVEETDVTIAELRAKFGFEIAELVNELTSISKPEDGNRAARAKIDLDHLAQASPGAKTIKLADIIRNVPSVIERDPQFARVYLPEKREQLTVLSDGDADLYEMASSIIEEYFNGLS